MDVILNFPETRVLGSLIEKQLTTPEYYPMTLNALTNACNQKTNRDPVVAYDERGVLRALETLRSKSIVQEYSQAGGRTLKYQQSFAGVFELSPQEVAVLCTLMLRGPQTAGEVKARSNRLHAFETIDEVETTLQTLAARDVGALTSALPIRPGQKEIRYAHLLSGEPELPAENAHELPLDKARLDLLAEDERINALEAQVSTLSNELAALRDELNTFKKQFE